MTRTTVPRRFQRLTRTAVSLVAASALALSGGIFTAAPASASPPLIGACLVTDGQISVGLAGTIPSLLGLGLVRVKVFDSRTGGLLGESLQIQLGPLGTINLDDLLIPITGTAPAGVNFQVVDLLGNVITSLLGQTPCDATNPIDPITGAYIALNPSRILDTRSGLGGATKIPARGTITLQLPGKGGLPHSGIDAVNLNLTATGGGAAGNITAYPAGQARPNTSSLNYVHGQDVANTVFAQLGSQGKVNFYNNSTQPVNLVADVAGYFKSGLLPLLPGSYKPLKASRIFDTRQTGTGGKLGPLSVRPLKVGGRGGIPSNVSAVVLNLTVTNATARGHITAWPGGTPLPYASNVNFIAGQSNADLVVVRLGSDGKINLRSGSVAGTVDVIVDVVGYFASGILPVQTAGLQHNATIKRLLDTRHQIGTTIAGKVPARGTRTVKIDGKDGIPSNFVRAVFVTVTTTEEQAPGSITEYPGGSTRPNASILNFTPTRDIANLVLASVGADGNIVLYNGSAAPTHLVADVSGYITGDTVSIG